MSASGRSVAWAVGRAVVVVAASGVGYWFAVPDHSAEPSRVAALLPARNGTSDLPGKAKDAGAQPVSSAGLASLTAAARAHRDQTALAVAKWQGAAPATAGAPPDGLVDVVFLTPSVATARKVAAEVTTQVTGTATYTGAGLVQAGTFRVAGVPGSTGAVYHTPPAGPTPASIATAVFSVDRVVGFVEVTRTSGSPQADAEAAVRTSAAHLRAVEPGFTLTPTRYPAAATAAWAAGTVVLAAVVGAGPLLRRRRAERREAARLAEQERLIRVGGSTIVRTRRGAGT
ncbi:MAG TPA: hypothetical protein VFP61_07945 [Acidimicrobiales bacterium]|nr:hypothetical protein [Acidimicrobiales bacterium]